MDKGTYTYTGLSQKYHGFIAPACEITIGKRTIKGNTKLIPDLEVELTADGTASGCSFTIDGQYDVGDSRWKDDLDKAVQVGAKLIIRGGYEKQRELFYGFIDDYTFELTSEDAPKVRVTGVDGLAYLMNLREPYYGGKEKAAQIVRKILNRSVSAGFAKSITIGQLTDFETPIVKEQIDDWRFLNIMAQRHGATLMAVDGELVFDKLANDSSPILTLTHNSNLRSFIKRVSLAHQVGFVEIWGRDVNQKAIKGVARDVTLGSGKSAAQVAGSLKEAGLREYSEFARTEKECQILAQNRLNGIALGFASGEGSCVGIPEIIAGRYVKIDSQDPTMKGKYFLTKVRHRFTMDGYTTSFEFKAAKIKGV